jgi:hypothetical protein
MKKTIFLLFLFIPSLIFAQSPDWLWANSAGGTGYDYGRSVTADDSGNVYVTGNFNSASLPFGTTTLMNANAGSHDIFVTKYDENGNVLWAMRNGGSNNDYAQSIAVDDSGNVYVSGYFTSPTITFGTTTLLSAGSTDVFIVKYDGSGNVIWATGAGGSGGDYAQSIAADASGNVYMTGYFDSATLTFGTTVLTNAGSSNIFIAKYDGNGNVIWATHYGGSSNDYAVSITANSSGKVYITGYFNSPTLSFGSTILNNVSNHDIFVVKFDANGNVLWAKSNGGSGGDYGQSIAADGSGNVYVTGYFISPTITFGTTTLNNVGGSDIFIAKYDGSGNILWATSNGGSATDAGDCVAADASGNVYVTGYFNSSSLTFGTTTLINAGSYDVFTVKYDVNGNILWSTGNGGASLEGGDGIAADNLGNVYVTGYSFSSSLPFGSTDLTNAGGYDIYVAKFGVCIAATFSQNLAICPGESITVGANTYFSSGTYIDTLVVGNACDSIVTTYLTIRPTYDTTQNVIINQADTLFVGNNFYTIQGSYADTLVAMNGCDSIINTNLTVLMGVGEFPDQIDLFIYPNPAHGMLNISFTGNGEGIDRITINNLFGQEVFSWMQPYPKNKFQVDISNHPAGIYFIHINQNNKIKTCKLIIE